MDEKERVVVGSANRRAVVASPTAPDWKKRYDWREMYKVEIVPAGALFLIGGADVQRDRIEVEVVGCGYAATRVI